MLPLQSLTFTALFPFAKVHPTPLSSTQSAQTKVASDFLVCSPRNGASPWSGD